jgi:hypothetical protein
LHIPDQTSKYSRLVVKLIVAWSCSSRQERLVVKLIVA